MRKKIGEIGGNWGIPAYAGMTCAVGIPAYAGMTCAVEIPAYAGMTCAVRDSRLRGNDMCGGDSRLRGNNGVLGKRTGRSLTQYHRDADGTSAYPVPSFRIFSQSGFHPQQLPAK